MRIAIILFLVCVFVGGRAVSGGNRSATNHEQEKIGVYDSFLVPPGNIQPVQSQDGEVLCRYYRQTFETAPSMQSFKRLPPVNGIYGYQEVMRTFSELICNLDSPFHYSKLLGIAYNGGNPSGSRLVASKDEDGVVDIFTAYSSTLPGRTASEYTNGVLCAMTYPDLFTSALDGRYPASLKKTTLLSVGPEIDTDGTPASFRTHMKGKNVLIFPGFQIETEIRRVTIEAEGRSIQVVILAEAREINMMKWMLQIKFGLTDLRGRSYGLVYNRLRIGTSFYHIALEKYTKSIDEELQIIFETNPRVDSEQVKQTWLAYIQSMRE